MLSTIKIHNHRFFSGAQAGLPCKTLTVTLAVDGIIEDWPAVEARFRTGVTDVWPSEPLWNVLPDDWPKPFIIAPSVNATFPEWIVALTVAFQRWAREPAWQGQVLSVSNRFISLALPWHRQAVCKSALQFALSHLLLWSQPKPSIASKKKFAEQLENWLLLVQPGGLSPNSLRFAFAAYIRNIPTSVSLNHLRLGWGRQIELLDSSFSGGTSNVATRIARNKNHTSRLLTENSLPVPPSGLVSNWDQARKLAEKLNWPVVVKPSNQDQGHGVVPRIRDEATLQYAYETAAKLSPGTVIVEKHIEGDDHRMLVVGGKLLMTTRRIPGGVTGDGEHSITLLVQAVNTDPRRGASKRSLLIALTLDDEALHCLTEQGLTFTSVPEAGRFVRLRRTANIGTGGTAEDMTAHVHPDNRALAERAARLVGLDIAGVDFLCLDISRSWREVGGVICEVNAQPGFRVHWLGNPARDINAEVIDWLFRDKTARIPTAAITGTNGKSTVARMLHSIWMSNNRVAGVCTTNGVWVGNDLISDKNLSGFPGGRLLLNDPSVEAAIIEMPRKGMLLFGHPCDRYDVAALLNVQDDHIGVNGITSLEEMAQLKAQVLERASQAVVINAEDPLCLAMVGKVSGVRIILVARNANISALQEHLSQNGASVFTQLHQGTPWIVLAEGAAQIPLMPMADIPATMKGLLRHNETNALFAVALAWAQQVAPDTIRTALEKFANTPEQNPGRYNFIAGLPFKVLLDYGHNPDGVQELCKLVNKLPISGQRHLLNLKIGNRHRAHLDMIAPDLARTFSHFVLGCDSKYVRNCADYAGDAPETTMLAASRDSLLQLGVQPNALVMERDQTRAIKLALANARPGDLLVLLAEPWIALPILDEACKMAAPIDTENKR